MDLNLPGGEELLQKLLQQHPWVNPAQLLLMAASIAANLWLLAVLIRNPSIKTAWRPGPAPWNFRRGMELFARYGLVFFGVMIFILMLRQEFGQPLRQRGVDDLHVTALGMALGQGLALLLIGLFMRRNRRQIAAFWKGPSPRRALLGFGLFLLVLMPVGLAMLLVEWIYRQLGIPFDPQPLILQLYETDATWFVALLSVFAVGVAPVVEEVVFRGILFPTLRDRWGMTASIVISSAIFAAMHFHAPTFLPLFILGVILCIAFQMTGSLPVCILAHSLFNSLSIILIWLLRGLR
jgi:CAAX protease family protein